MYPASTLFVALLATLRAVQAIPAPAPSAALQELEARYGDAVDYSDTVMQGDSWMKRDGEAAAALEKRKVVTSKVTKTSKVGHIRMLGACEADVFRQVKYTVTKNKKPVVRTKTVKTVQTIRSTVPTVASAPTLAAAAKAVVSTRKVVSTQRVSLPPSLRVAIF